MGDGQTNCLTFRNHFRQHGSWIFFSITILYSVQSYFMSYFTFWFQFSRLLSSTAGPHSSQLENYVTVLAPTNAAMEAYRGARDIDFILNHFGEQQPQTQTSRKISLFQHFTKRISPRPDSSILIFQVSTSVSPEDIGGNHRLSSLREGQPPLWVRYCHFIMCW